MTKRQWPSVFFILAFAISLAHSSIPHSHPEPKEDKRSHHHDHNKHHGHHGSKGHCHHTPNDKSHHHDEGDSEPHQLPVFAHFSNAEYISIPPFKFSCQEKILLEYIAPVPVILHVPVIILHRNDLPRARDLPSDAFFTITSLRAPPLFS